jgi:hypothetical protein
MASFPLSQEMAGLFFAFWFLLTMTITVLLAIAYNHQRDIFGKPIELSDLEDGEYLLLPQEGTGFWRLFAVLKQEDLGNRKNEENKEWMGNRARLMNDSSNHFPNLPIGHDISVILTTEKAWRQAGGKTTKIVQRIINSRWMENGEKKKESKIVKIK